MEDQIIVFELSSGEIKYATCPAKMKKPGETTREWLLRQFNKTVRDNYPGAKRILDAVMPDGQPFAPGAKKLFYGAWRHAGGGQVTIDMLAARQIHMGDIRAERNARFPPLDAEWMKATGQKDSVRADAIEAARQALRDLPATIDMDAITTPEALEAFAPDWPGLP